MVCPVECYAVNQMSDALLIRVAFPGIVAAFFHSGAYLSSLMIVLSEGRSRD